MKNQKILSVVLSVTLSFLGVAAIAYGATTIGTSITTAGDISTATASSTGQVKLDNLVVGQVSAGATISAAGAISASSTLNVTGLTTLVNASTTRVSISGNLMVNGNATTTSTGAISTQGSLKVGASGSTLTKMVAGYCTIATLSPVASSTAYADCTPDTAGLIAANDIVMVMATGSLPTNFSIKAASSSAANVISVQIYNHGYNSTAATGINSFNFIAVTK
jgi:hypothetical protein